MKKNNVLKVVLIAILVAIVCTWILPTMQYTQTGSIETGERVQVGIFTLTEYARVLFNNFSYVLLVVFAIGAFYGVAYKIPAYRYLLDTIVEKFKGKEKAFLISVIIIISIIVSLTGFKLGIGILFIFPLIISVILLMGYNKLVAASVTVGSAVVGMIGATLSTTTGNYLNLVLDTTYDAEIVSKIILLVLGLVLLVYNVLAYANKTRNETDKVLAYVPLSIEYDEVEVVKTKKEKKKLNINFSFITKLFSKKDRTKKEKKVKTEKKKDNKKDKKKEATKKEVIKKTTTKKKAPAKKSKKTKANDNKADSVKVIKGGNKVKVWPFIVVFDLLLLIIILSVFDWSLFKLTWPTDALNAIKEFKLFDFPIFDKILGGTSLNEFGNWSLNYEIPMTIFIFTGLLALMYKVSFNKFIDGMIDGMKKAFVPALTMFIAYFVLIICVQNLFQLQITKFLLELTNGLNVITMSIALMFSSLFNVEAVYIAQTTLPYVTTVITDTSLYSVVAVMTQAMYGLVMLIAPTSVILIGVLSYLDIPYLQWIKHIWKLFLELLLVLLVFFLILVLI